MSADATETQHFALPPEEVFDYVVDFSHLAEWDPMFTRSRAVSDDQAIGVGTRFEVVADVLGNEVPVDYTVEEYDRPRHARLVGRGDGFTSIDEIDVEPEEGGSRLRWTASVETDTPLIGTAATPIFKAVAKASMSGLDSELSAR